MYADSPSARCAANGAAEGLGDQLVSEADADGLGAGAVQFAHETDETSDPRVVVVYARPAARDEIAAAVLDAAGVALKSNIEELERGLPLHAAPESGRKHGGIVAEPGALRGIDPVGLKDADVHQNSRSGYGAAGG